MVKFAERLKEVRKEKGLSQTQLAKATGLSQPAIAKWENGERNPTIYNIYTLCVYLKVTSDFLIGLTDY